MMMPVGRQGSLPSLAHLQSYCTINCAPCGMYQGLDKSGGGVVGSNASGTFSQEFSDVCDVSSAEETLVCLEPGDDDQERKVFVTAILNSYNGCVEWTKNYDEERIMRRTIGMSQMTSMLHDVDRNRVYERAIATSIQHFIKRCGRPPTVLDIGTGTGLLAMMCVRHGAAFVVACEMFEAMANVAREVIKHNGMDDRILVVPAKSCDVESLPFAPDIVLSELLDTALLGEGVMFSHADAIDRFIDPTPCPGTEASAFENDIRMRVIPYAATVFGQLVESTELLHMSTVDGQCIGGFSAARAFPPPSSSSTKATGDRVQCPWGRLFPVHWETQFKDSKTLSSPVALLDVEFFHSLSSAQALEGVSRCRVTAAESGTIHGLLVWWKADLLPPELSGEDGALYSYSTEPGTSHAWQDHWQQTVFPLGGHGGGYVCERGDVFEVTTCHDGLHMWCAVDKIPPCNPEGDVHAALKRPRVEENLELTDHFEQCRCGWHLLCGPERMLQLNDSFRLGQWQKGIDSLMDRVLPCHGVSGPTPLVLDVSDGSVLAFMAARNLTRLCSVGTSSRSLGHILSLERKPYSALFHRQLIASNSSALAENALVVLDDDEWADSWVLGRGERPVWEEVDKETMADGDSREVIGQYVAAVICECFFYQLHSLPMQSALSFYYAVNGIKKSTKGESGGNRKLQVCPQQAHVMIAAFELSDLHISHGVAGIVSGFDHSPLDDIQQDWHTNLFPYKMGAYRKKLLTGPACLGVLDYAGDAIDEYGISVNSVVNLRPVTTGRCDCFIVWVDYVLDKSNTIEFWDGNDFPTYLKTSVKFLERPQTIDRVVGQNEDNCECIEFRCCSTFGYGESSLSIDIQVI